MDFAPPLRLTIDRANLDDGSAVEVFDIPRVHERSGSGALCELDGGAGNFDEAIGMAETPRQ